MLTFCLTLRGVILIVTLLMFSICDAGELLLRAVDKTHTDPIENVRGVGKRGFPIVCQPDGHVWGDQETWPNYVYIKVPLISCSKMEKYLQIYYDWDNPDVNGRFPIKMPRLWKLRWADLPQGAKDKFLNNHQLIIKAAAAYTGSYDYTWNQIKTYIRNQYTNLDETANLE
jgi:hypothetical protein